MANRFRGCNYYRRKKRGRCRLRRSSAAAAPGPEPVPITSIVPNNVQLLRYLRHYGTGLIILNCSQLRCDSRSIVAYSISRSGERSKVGPPGRSKISRSFSASNIVKKGCRTLEHMANISVTKICTKKAKLTYARTEIKTMCSYPVTLL